MVMPTAAQPELMTVSDKDDIKLKFKQATALATIQEMLSKLSVKCFQKCVQRPTEALQGSEERCISLCMDRYVDCYNLVARAYGNRLQQELRRSQREVDPTKPTQ